MVRRDIPPGGPESEWSLGTAWAHVSNTPFRMYKRNMHEGGICSPMIMHWPEAGYQAGSISELPVHILDFLPTFHALAGGEKTPPGIEGTDLSDIWKSGAQYREYEMMGYLVDHRYILQNDWKLVSVDGLPWELFNIHEDRNEINNLADIMPEKVTEMESAWNSWYFSFSNTLFIDPDENPDKLLRRTRAHMGDKGSGVPYTPAALPD